LELLLERRTTLRNPQSRLNTGSAWYARPMENINNLCVPTKTPESFCTTPGGRGPVAICDSPAYVPSLQRHCAESGSPLRHQFCPKKLLLSKKPRNACISDCTCFKCSGKSEVFPKMCRNDARIMWRSVFDSLLASSRFVGLIGICIKGGIAR
jgi:hypothetical protein